MEADPSPFIPKSRQRRSCSNHPHRQEKFTSLELRHPKIESFHHPTVEIRRKLKPTNKVQQSWKGKRNGKAVLGLATSHIQKMKCK